MPPFLRFYLFSSRFLNYLDYMFYSNICNHLSKLSSLKLIRFKNLTKLLFDLAIPSLDFKERGYKCINKFIFKVKLLS